MKLLALVALTMCAFAGNSILNRAGVDGQGMDPMVFATIRVFAGAVTLALLLRFQGKPLPLTGKLRWGGAVSLAIYMLGFSWAYITLGAGLGALILFGVVQMVMFLWAVSQRQPIPLLRWIGAAIAFSGLTLLLWPAQAFSVPLGGAISMAAAGAAWAVYTLLGQQESDALAATAGNFVLCLPLTAFALLFHELGAVTFAGVALAVLAGAVTSGLGYALWYRVLPAIPTTLAAVAQLSVPVIAVLAGWLLLGEGASLRMLMAGGLVLGGIALSLRGRTR